MLPFETTVAVFPPEYSVGNIRLKAPTLYHAVSLEMMGIDPLGGDINAANAWCAAFILTKDAAQIRDFMAGGNPDIEAVRKWTEKCKEPVSQMVQAVRSALKSATITHVPGKSKTGGANLMPKGFGWPIEIAEALMAEYKMSFDEAMSEPMCRVFGLMACCRSRNGGEDGGPDYYARILINSLKTMKIGGGKEVANG